MCFTRTITFSHKCAYDICKNTSNFLRLYLILLLSVIVIRPIPVAARSKAWVYGRSPAGIVGSNPTGGMDVCVECCVLSGRGLCDGLITLPEESYRLWCVVVCDLETSRMRRPWPALGRSTRGGGEEL